MASPDTRVKIIDIQVRYQQAVEDMAKYRAAIEEAKKEMTRLKKELKDGNITQAEYGKQMEACRILIQTEGTALNALSRQVNAQLRVQREQEGSLKALRAELSQATAAYDALSRAERESAKGEELKNHINAITRELKEAEESTSRFYRNVGNYPKDVDATVNGINNKFKSIGTTLLGIATGGGLMAFSQKIMQVGRDFNDGMARVNAVVQGTEEEFQMMSEEAKKMGSTTAYTAAEAAGALENLTRNGLTAEQATAALSKTMRFAQANSISLAEAADIMTNVSNGFNMGVEGMTDVSDKLSFAASHSATNVSELAEALKNAAPFGHALGQPIEEVNAGLGVLADVGIKGADAGTAMRMVMLGLASPTAKQQKVFKEFGIEIDQQSLKTEGLTKTLQKLKESGIMDAADSADKLAMVFGRRVSPQAMALLNNVDKLETKLTGLRTEEDTTTKMFNVSMSEVSQQVKSLESAWEGFMLKIYNSNADSMVKRLETLVEFVRWLTANLPLVGQILMSVIASISFAKIATAAMSAFTTIRNSAVINAQEASTAATTAAQEYWTVKRQLLAKEQELERTSGAERTRIAAEVSAKKRELATAEANFTKLNTQRKVEWERAAALETGNKWTVAWTTAKVGMLGFINATKAAMKSFALMAVISLVIEGVMLLWSKLKEGDGVIANIKNAFQTFFTTLKNWVLQALNWFMELYNKVMPIRAAIQMIGAALQSLGQIVALVFNLMIDAAKGVGRHFAALGEIFKGVFTWDWNTIKNGFSKMTSNIGQTLTEGIADIKKAGAKMGQAFTDGYNASLVDGHMKTFEIPEDTQQKQRKKVYRYTNKDGSQTFKDEQGNIIGSKKAATTTQTTLPADADNVKGGGESDADKKAREKAAKEAERKRKEQAKAAEEERKLVYEAEQALLKLTTESWEAKRKLTEIQYNGEIDKLKLKLKDDHTLTENAKNALISLIKTKEVEKQNTLDQLSREELQKTIKAEQEKLEARLKYVQKGSEEELKIKQQLAQDKYNLALAEINQKEQNAMAGADATIDLRNQDVKVLEDSGASDEDVEAARNKVIAAEEAKAELEEQYAELRANAMQDRYLAEDEARRAHEQAVYEEQQLLLENEIANKELKQTEKENREFEQREQEMTLEESLRLQDLDVVQQHELDKLAIQQQMAEQELQFIINRGQLETQTEAQYNAEILAAKQKNADAKKKINDASLKNEQAYSKSMKSVGDSLVSVIDMLGESNKEFAMLSKSITLFKILVDTGQAISAGVKNAMELPFPGNVAAVATTVATVMANIVTATKTVQSANFAEGGKVLGPGTGTSDSIPANLSNGEFIMTAKATKLFEPLLVAMNGIGKGVPMQVSRSFERVGDADMLEQSFTMAVENIRPVVSVEEINNVQQQVEVIENLDVIS